MKKIKFILLFICSVMLTTSCDYLDMLRQKFPLKKKSSVISKLRNWPWDVFTGAYIGTMGA